MRDVAITPLSLPRPLKIKRLHSAAVADGTRIRPRSRATFSRKREKEETPAPGRRVHLTRDTTHDIHQTRKKFSQLFASRRACRRAIRAYWRSGSKRAPLRSDQPDRRPRLLRSRIRRQVSRARADAAAQRDAARFGSRRHSGQLARHHRHQTRRAAARVSGQSRRRAGGDHRRLLRLL